MVVFLVGCYWMVKEEENQGSRSIAPSFALCARRGHLQSVQTVRCLPVCDGRQEEDICTVPAVHDLLCEDRLYQQLSTFFQQSLVFLQSNAKMPMQFGNPGMHSRCLLTIHTRRVNRHGSVTWAVRLNVLLLEFW